jgi:tetratricopeptide (TPR) repeat protein
MSKYSLIPGMEAFMEDTSVEVDVEVGAPEEVVEEVTEAEEVASEGAEEVAEAEADAEQAEMIFQQFDRVENYISHVKKYGVDRTFLSLLNSDGSLSQAIGYSLPACESFDVTGSPMSAESQAVIAGLESVFGEIWKFIKKIAAKVRDFFSKIWNWVMARVGDIDKNIGRLRKRLGETDFDKEKADKATGDVIDLAYLENDQKSGADVQDFLNKAQQEFNALKNQINLSLKNLSGNMPVAAQEDTSKEYTEAFKKFKKAFSDAKKNAQKKPMKEMANDVEKYLTLASNCRKQVIQNEALVKNAKNAADLIENAVKKFENHEADGHAKEASKSLRRVASRLNELTSVTGVEISYCNWRASQAVKAAAAIISNTRKPRG